MRPVTLASAVVLVALFSACNAILGNESEYELVPDGGDQPDAGDGGTAGSATAGKGGSAGSTSGNGGKGSGGKGSAGSSNSGGRGGNGTATGGASGEAGATDVAGQGGDAGGTSCEATGPEDCFNGRDDDCNGAVDCEDSACEGPAECRAALEGAELGYFVSQLETCPSGYTPIDLKQELQVSYVCNGCSCINPTQLQCDSSVVALAPGTACPGFQTVGNSENVYNDSCSALPSALNLHFYSIRGTAQCTPSGTPTLDPPAWTYEMVFCMLDRVGGGCRSGEACLPVETGALCTLTDDEDDCTDDFSSDHGTWHEGFVDERSCNECQCGLGTSDCSGAYIAGYTQGACGGTVTQLGTGDQGDICGLPAPLQTGKIVGTPTNGSCQPNVFVNGDATPMGPHKACCQP